MFPSLFYCPISSRLVCIYYNYYLLKFFIKSILINYLIYQELKVEDYNMADVCSPSLLVSVLSLLIGSKDSAAASLPPSRHSVTEFNASKIGNLNLKNHVGEAESDVEINEPIVSLKDHAHPDQTTLRYPRINNGCKEETEYNFNPGEGVSEHQNPMFPLAHNFKCDIRGEDLKEIGHFLLFLHPDQYTYVATLRKNAYYLFGMYSQRRNSSGTYHDY